MHDDFLDRNWVDHRHRLTDDIDKLASRLRRSLRRVGGTAPRPKRSAGG